MESVDEPWLAGEPALEDALRDPIVRLLMRRDGWTAKAVRARLEQAVRGRRDNPDMPPHAA